MPGAVKRTRMTRVTEQSVVSQISVGEINIRPIRIIRDTGKHIRSMLPKTGKCNKNAMKSARYPIQAQRL
jgi:hypothetical protein